MESSLGTVPNLPHPMRTYHFVWVKLAFTEPVFRPDYMRYFCPGLRNIVFFCVTL